MKIRTSNLVVALTALSIISTCANPVWAAERCSKIFTVTHVTPPEFLSLENILKRVKSYEVQLPDGSDSFVQDPIDTRTVRAYEEIPFSAQIEIAPILRYMSPAELTLIANSKKIARKFLTAFRTYRGPLFSHLDHVRMKKVGSEQVDFLQQGAKLILLRIKFPNLSANLESHSPTGLKRQAEIAGLHFVQMPQVFRYDSRSPQQIIKADGFRSNPDAALGTILEHSVINSSGQGFISTTTRPGNIMLASSDFIVRAGEYLTPKLSQSDRIELARQALGNDFDHRENYEHWYFKKIYEYRLKNIDGVFPVGRLSIPEEAEFVTADVPILKVTHYREVISVMRDISNPKFGSGVVFFDWKPMSFSEK